MFSCFCVRWWHVLWFCLLTFKLYVSSDDTMEPRCNSWLWRGMVTWSRIWNDTRSCWLLSCCWIRGKRVQSCWWFQSWMESSSSNVTWVSGCITLYPKSSTNWYEPQLLPCIACFQSPITSFSWIQSCLSRLLTNLSQLQSNFTRIQSYFTFI